jgi:hypothetical protein
MHLDLSIVGSREPSPPVPAPSRKKVLLMRELKALGLKPKAVSGNPWHRPDYTKELAEPSWGDESENDETYMFEEVEDVDEYGEVGEDEDDYDDESKEGMEVEVKGEDDDEDMKLSWTH